MGCIYMAHCKVNGKGYVGKTTQNFEQYKLEHKKNAESGENGPRRAFYRAIRKYGWDAFEWLILYQDEDDDKEWMSWWERKFIRELGTKAPGGYNMTDGGEGGACFAGRKHSPESIEKMKNHVHSQERKEKNSASHQGVPLSEAHRLAIIEGLRRYKQQNPISAETKKKISRSLEGRSNHGSLGIPKTEEHKAKIRESMKGRGAGIPKSEEHKAKIRAGILRWLEGKKGK